MLQETKLDEIQKALEDMKDYMHPSIYSRLIDQVHDLAAGEEPQAKQEAEVKG